MKAGTLLKIMADIIPILEHDGIIDDVGDFHEPSVSQWAALAGQIEAVLHNHGVTVQENVDKVINGLPLILSLLGVK